MDCNIVFDEREPVPRSLSLSAARVVGGYLTGERMMRKRPDHSCVALVDGRCAIYERRPFLCQELAPGDEYCLTARALHAQGRTDINTVLT